MDDNYWHGNADKYCNLKMEANNCKVSWHQHTLLLASALLGLLAGLNPNLGDCLFIRISFGATIIFLAFGIAFGAIALYGYQVKIGEDKAKVFHKELSDALKENRELGVIYSHLPKFYLWASNLSSVFLLLSLLTVVAYSMMTILG